MAQIDATVVWDISEAMKWLSGHKRQGDYALMRALNDVARDAQEALRGASKQYLDRPTPYIQNAWRYQKATKGHLSAYLFPEQQTREPYLRANIYGGTRGIKPMEGKFASVASTTPPGERFFPTRYQRRDSRGNVTKGAISKLIESAQAKEQGRNSVFIGKPANSTKPYGIYRRMGEKRRTLRPLFLLATKPMQYKPIFPVEEIGHKVVERRLQGYFASYLDQALRTAR